MQNLEYPLQRFIFADFPTYAQRKCRWLDSMCTKKKSCLDLNNARWKGRLVSIYARRYRWLRRRDISITMRYRRKSPKSSKNRNFRTRTGYCKVFETAILSLDHSFLLLPQRQVEKMVEIRRIQRKEPVRSKCPSGVMIKIFLAEQPQKTMRKEWTDGTAGVKEAPVELREKKTQRTRKPSGHGHAWKQ